MSWGRDESADALYVRYLSEKPNHTTELTPDVIFDWTADGRLIGVELLNVGRET